MYLKLDIHAHTGYTPAQAAEYVRTLTVGALREMLEGYDADTQIVTFDTANGLGAEWGSITAESLEEVSDKGDEADYDEDND